MVQTKALWVSNYLKLGQSGIGKYGPNIGTVKQVVHDGDTVNTLFLKNLAVRFLGIDTPEISFQLPGKTNFTDISNQKWDDLFTSGEWKNGLQIGNDLLNYLENPVRIGNGVNVAANHEKYAEEAHSSLEEIIQFDLTLSGRTKETFLFFMSFAHEFLDVYGRLLAYLHSDRESFAAGQIFDESSYNERQLATGLAVPYFIWPNVQPFLKIQPFSAQNVAPAGFWNLVNVATKLNKARQSVTDARANGLGIFNPAEPIKVMPFELRFISRKTGPDRYVIDLTDIGGNTLLDPQKYFTINPEDRLFVPDDYVPIFESYGWVKG